MINQRIFVCIATVVMLAGCGTAEAEQENTPEKGSTEVFTVDVGDREVTCVSWVYNYSGGLSCDWENA